MDALAMLLEKDSIKDCLKRYARGVDRRDWAMVRACFHVDSIDHHGEFRGNRDEFIEWVRKRHADVPFSMHYLLNCLIELVSDESAAVETYFWAIQRRKTKSGDGASEGTDHEVFGRYLDRFEKRKGTWRIAIRQVVYDSTRQMPSSNHLHKIVGILGRRDNSDPVFGMQQAAE